jgi:hypothetical protein
MDHYAYLRGWLSRTHLGLEPAAELAGKLELHFKARLAVDAITDPAQRHAEEAKLSGFCRRLENGYPGVKPAQFQELWAQFAELSAKDRLARVQAAHELAARPPVDLILEPARRSTRQVFIRKAS